MQARKAHMMKIDWSYEKGKDNELLDRINWSVQIEELTTGITLTVSDLQSGEWRVSTPREVKEL